jgi:serine/threonine protein kinase
MTYPPESQDFEDLYIVTELFEADLSRILSSKQALQDAHAVYFVYQLLRGLKYLHSAGVLHRDLKPSNLLVNSNCDLAICDFGLARGLAEDAGPLTGYVVTRWYRPPELLCESTTYDQAVDVWSAGVMLLCLLSRSYPLLPGRQDAEHALALFRLFGDAMAHGIAEGAGKLVLSLPSGPPSTGLSRRAATSCAGLWNLVQKGRALHAGRGREEAAAFDEAFHLCMCLLNPDPSGGYWSDPPLTDRW